MNGNNATHKQFQTLPQEKTQLFDFKQLRDTVITKWYWLAASVFLCVLVTGVYLWISPTTVNVTGKMEIIDKSKKGGSNMSAGLAMLNNLPIGLGTSLGGAASLGIDAEKEILLSNVLVKNVVDELNLHTEYRLCKWGRKSLLYQNNPITASLDAAHLKWMEDELPLTAHQILLTITKSGSNYEVETTLKENKDKVKLPSQTFSKLPATVKTDAGTVTLTENKLSAKQAQDFEDGYTLKVTIAPSSIVADAFIKRTYAEPPSKKVMNMLNITIEDENVVRGIDFITHLVDAYNQRANDEKNEEARKTDEFVNARLAKIDAELGSSDAAWENSKKQFQITEPEVDAQEALTKKSEYEARLVAISTELQLHDYLSEYINNPANLYEIIPPAIASSLSSSDNTKESSGSQGNASLIARHNALVNQRKDLLKSVSEMSPQVQRLTESIQELHPTLQLAMKRDRQQLVMKKDAINREYGKYSSRIGNAPQMERVLTEIGRQREIKQGVYLLMLQKREETAMELANTTDKGRLIDTVKGDVLSAKPKKKAVLLAALVFGAIIPVSVFYLLQLLKTRIDTRRELEAVSKLPVLGEISSTRYDDSIRDLRTKLLINISEGHKTILVVSQNGGDGKTFIATKLAESFNVIGKKCEFVNADLRSLNLSKGQHAADILAGADFAMKIAKAKSSNDYVIIDTPALRKYSDALQLSQFADVTLCVAKAGHCQKSDIVSLNKDYNLPNPVLVLNK